MIARAQKNGCNDNDSGEERKKRRRKRRNKKKTKKEMAKRGSRYMETLAAGNGKVLFLIWGRCFGFFFSYYDTSKFNDGLDYLTVLIRGWKKERRNTNNNRVMNLEYPDDDSARRYVG